MHGAAGCDNSGEFPTEGTGIDQFTGDTDGNFFRSHGLWACR